MSAVRRAAGASALLALAVRLPFVVGRLWDHDSIQFALAVREFDLAAHHPHPPGYPLYVAVLKVLAAVGVEPLAGMLAMSLLASAIGAGCFALVAVRLSGGGAPLALLAGVLYATDPLLWFYGEIPLVYAVEGGLTTVLALAALRLGEGPRSFVLACALFALAGGMRPTTLLLLLPLFFYALAHAWRRRSFPSPRWLAAGVGAAVVIVLAWAIPLVAASGGVAAYRRIANAHFIQLLPVTSVFFGAGWPALTHNLTVLTKWALQGTLPALAVVAVGWAMAPRRAGDGVRLLASRAAWIVAWALPPVLFFACFHVTKAGYTLIHLPALLAALVLLAAPVVGAGTAEERRPARSGWNRAVLLSTSAATLGAAIFFFAAPRGADAPRWLAVVRHEFNYSTLRTYEHDLDELIAVLDAQPPPRTLLATVELAGRGGAGSVGFLYPYHRHLQWFAPDSPVALLVPEDGAALLRLAGDERFRRHRGMLPVPGQVDRVLFVLAGSPDPERLVLPTAEVVLANPTFLVLELPFDGTLRVGGVELRATPAAVAAVGG